MDAPATTKLCSVDRSVETRILSGAELRSSRDRLCRFWDDSGVSGLAGHPDWLETLAAGLGHRGYAIEATRARQPSGSQTVGLLPLAYLHTRLFGRFLVSLPYINSSGVIAGDPAAARALIDRAVELADELDVRYLELRHETPIEHPSFNGQLDCKVHMRLTLPGTSVALWNALKAKVRNQLRKAQQQSLTVHWGAHDLLPEFYRVFARNMRDLGTPVYGRRLFVAMLERFANNAEIAVVRRKKSAVAAAIILHGRNVTETPSASSLREHNGTNANMLLYWSLLERAISRGQGTFDFGRSTRESNTYRFKKQWGAEPQGATWQYYLRRGTAGDLRPESGKYRAMIRGWQRLPVGLTRLIGPAIVRGIP